MSAYKPVQIVEIDIDTCSLTWGVPPCMAAFGGIVVRKCYNTFQTCDDTQNYTKTVKTLKFIEASYSVKSGNYIPALVNAGGGYEQTVNISGYSPNLGALGQRAKVTVTMRDFPYRDVLTDDYWAERMSGDAQTDEPGYDPIDRGSFWTKFKARNPNYAGRPLRVIQAHYDDAGALVYDKVRSYVMDEFKGPDKSGNVTIVAKDILSLADDTKAVAPKNNRGRLLAEIDAVATTLTMTPAGIGNLEYASSGFATIGSEIVAFTRAADVMTITRGVKGTAAASHAANDTVQVCFDVSQVRGDEVIRSLLVDYGNIPSGYIDFAEWQAEFNKWGNQFKLSATICKPTGVSQLIGEINQLGVTVWWDEVNQKIRIQLSHPPEETPETWSDRNNIISITAEDNDDERATRIALWTVQIDPTKALNQDNFLRQYLYVSADSELPQMFDGERTKIMYNRWLNHGSDSASKILTGRLLNRYKRAPVTYNVVVDLKDDCSLTDVIALDSHVVTDETGNPKRELTQVFYRADEKSGSTVSAKLQMFQFDQRYGKIAPNDYPEYNAATDEQKIHGSFFVGPSLVFSDGSGPYQLI